MHSFMKREMAVLKKKLWLFFSMPYTHYIAFKVVKPLSVKCDYAYMNLKGAFNCYGFGGGWLR